MSVVVTGMGVVSALGTDIEIFFQNLCAGKNGVTKIESLDCSGLPVDFAGEIKGFDINNYVDNPKEARRLSRFIHYGVGAAANAVEMAGINSDNCDLDRVGVVLGSGMGGIEVFQDNVIKGAGNPRKVSPFFIPMSITNMQPGFVALQYGFRGPNFSISTACATGNHCIIESAAIIERGDADIVLAGGSEAPLNFSGISGFAAQRSISFREDFKSASCPFDKDRDGFVLGEGSGVLVLESEAHAKKRGAKILARYMGGGMSCDAHHITAPSPNGSGAALAMLSALRNAGLDPADIGHINGHATSTPLGDVAEVAAIKQVFGKRVAEIMVCATKSMIGHSLGAAAAIEAVTLVQSLRYQKIHPSINILNLDENCRLNIPEVETKLSFNYGMSNSFGFGGHNSAIIFGF